MGTEIQKWADRAMYAAKPMEAGGPKVTVLSASLDPLGEIACATMTYEGKFPAGLHEITDEQRRFYLDDVFKARRWAPLEFVNFHFLISGVTRAFTHQMVRQRTAVYAQESVRFAVKEDVPVQMPASLEGTIPWSEWQNKCRYELFPIGSEGGVQRDNMVREYAINQASPQQLWRREWDECVGDIATSYNALVNAGMPAEDARGLLPTNLQTRIHYCTNLRNLYEHAGNRLCTQAQHEWKVVWRKILEALQSMDEMYYGPEQECAKSNNWQYNELAKVFKPICYQTGKCEFMSSADRYCAIRDRVERNHKLGRPSVEWGEPTNLSGMTHVDNQSMVIHDEEWMSNHAAARIS
jgi:flavin-dependent thymidylate synthase